MTSYFVSKIKFCIFNPGQVNLGLHGHVSDINGHPVIGALVYIEDQDWTVNTDKHGNFHLLIHGSYQIVTQAPGYDKMLKVCIIT